MPVVSGEKCIGVLTLYSAHTEAFSEEQQGIVSAVLQHSAPALAMALAMATRSDINTGGKEVRRNSESRTDALLYIRVTAPRAEGGASVDAVTDSLTEVLLQGIGATDSLIRPSSKELLVVLRGMTASAAAKAGDILREKIARHAERALGLAATDVFVSPLLTAAPELAEENIVRLVRLRYASDTEDEGPPDRRVH